MLKRVALLAGAGLGALAARRYLGVRADMEAVAPELRSPLLPFLTMDITARTLPVARKLLAAPTEPGPGVTVTERTVPGSPAVPVFIVEPERPQPGAPAILWIHGGGMVMGSPRMELAVMGGFARELGAVVVSPDYRLAPEHPFPAPFDDCWTALTWMRENADELGVDPERVAVGGMSAGGGLAAAVAHRAHDEGIPVRAQGLKYPMLDDRTALGRNHQDRGRFVWTPGSNAYGWTAYLGHEPRPSDAPEFAAPARRTKLEGLPPAWIGVGELDLFLGEDLAYARDLDAAGVQVTVRTVPGMFHAAETLTPQAEMSRDFENDLIEHFRTHL